MKNIFFIAMVAMAVSFTACTNNAEQTELVAEPVDSAVVDSTEELYPAVDSTATAQ